MITTRLEIGNANYPLANDIPISINFVLADIREPDKRNSSFSKTIQFYGTNEVNKLFENIFELNSILGVFNPNKKTPAKYFADNLLVFEGSLQLLSVTLKPDNNILYECSIIGNEGGIFLDLGEAELTALDFTDYNHNYTRANIISSGANLSGVGYYYPFVDNGTSAAENDFKVENFMPCFFAYEYILKMITATGRTFTSTFLNSSFFKTLIVYPNFNEIRLTQTQIDNSQFYVGLNSAFTLTQTVTSIVPFDKETTPFFDPGGMWNASSYHGIIPSAANYNIISTIKVKMWWTHSDPAVVTYSGSWFLSNENNIRRSTNAGVSYSTIATNSVVDNTVYPEGEFPSTYFYRTIQIQTGSVALGTNDRIRNEFTAEGSPSGGDFLDLNGDPVYTGTYTFHTEIQTGTDSAFYAILTSPALIDGSFINAQSVIPTKIKQRDFFKSIIQMFNLYIDIDKTNPNNLIIENYDDFYNNGVVNWENKTDFDKDIKINPIGLLDAKRYIFKYKDDVDFYNKKYKDTYQETYGTETINVDNDFLNADKVNEVMFSPSPTVYNELIGANVVKIYKDQSTRDTVVPNIRLLIASGIKQAQNTWTFRSTGLSNVVSQNYNAALMEDDSIAITKSLQFGTPNFVYYSYPGAWTTHTLYNDYHKTRIDNIISKDSKVDVRYLWVNSIDMRNFSLRKKYFIDGSYFIVNKLVGYNPMNETSYKFELIRLLNPTL